MQLLVSSVAPASTRTLTEKLFDLGDLQEPNVFSLNSIKIRKAQIKKKKKTLINR